MKNAVRLGEVASYINGYAFKPEDRGEKGLPIIRIQDLTGNSYDMGYYDGEYPEKIEINDGDVLISWSASLGVYIWNGGKALLNQHIFKVVFDKMIIEKQYFVYAVRHKLKEMISKTHGATMKHIIKKDFDNTLIPFVSCGEQKEIASRINAVENIVAAHKLLIEKCDLLVKSRFVEMFGDPIKNDKRWAKKSIAEVCEEIYGGGTPSKSHPEYYENGNIPWVSSKDMKKDIIVNSEIYINRKGVENSTAKIVPVDSVIMVIRSGILKHTLPVAINAVEITVNQDLKVFIPKKEISSRFLCVLFKMMEKDILSGVRAVTADNIDFNSFKNRQIIVPPIENQECFVAFVHQVDKLKVTVQKSLDEAQTLFDSLMQQYFG